MVNKQKFKKKVTLNQDLVKSLITNIETRGNVPDVVVAHVKRNLLFATHISSICVDGGYNKEEASGELARPGADLGISLSLIGSGLTPKQAFLAVYNYRISQGQKYGWHSDNHEGHDGCVVGCGHCNAVITKNSYYNGVSKNDAEELLSIIRQYQDSNPENMRFIKLNRDHVEQGILVSNSEDVTVTPWDQEDDRDTQFFVYDAVRDEKLLEEVANFVNGSDLKNDQGKVITVTYKELKEVVDQHTDATLGLLDSSKGKPVYAISIEDEKLILDKVGNAPFIDED